MKRSGFTLVAVAVCVSGCRRTERDLARPAYVWTTSTSFSGTSIAIDANGQVWRDDFAESDPDFKRTGDASPQAVEQLRRVFAAHPAQVSIGVHGCAPHSPDGGYYDGAYFKFYSGEGDPQEWSMCIPVGAESSGYPPPFDKAVQAFQER